MSDKALTTNAQDLANTEYDAEHWAQVGAGRQSVPSNSRKVPSDPAHGPGVDLTQEERDAGQQAGQKRLGEDGLPSA